MIGFSVWRWRGLGATSLAGLGAILATTTPSRAAELWTGAASTDWFNAGNWSAGVPTNSTSTRIDTVTPNATVIGAAGAQATGLRVGVVDTGALTIQNGGTVSNTLGIIADQAGSTGTATVDGAGSSWTNSSDFYVGSGGSGILTIRNGGALTNVNGFIGRFSGATGVVTVDGAGSTWTNSGGDLNVGDSGSGTLTISNGGKVSNGRGFVGSTSGTTGTVTVDGAGSTWTSSRDLQIGASGSGALTISNGGGVSAPTTFIANRAGSTGTLNIGAAAGQAAAAPGTLTTTSVNFGAGAGQIVFNHTAANYVFAPAIAGTGTVRVEAGTTVLTATNSYSGPTMIDGGTLSVDGSIARSAVTVNAGGTLGGDGNVGTTVINGGTLASGNSTALTVNGNLSFTAASSYMVEISPATAGRVNVTGTAALSGAAVNASFALAAGSVVARQYTIVNAGGGISGTFGSVVNSNLPAGFKSSLSYDGNNAYLDLGLVFVAPPDTGFNRNQSSVANALVSSFNRNGDIPLVYGGLTAPGLTQASGPVATAGQPAMALAMTQFMTTITDLSGRGFGAPSAAGAMGFAEAGDPPSADAAARRRGGPERDAFGMIAKAAPRATALLSNWRTWASGFGGGQTTGGNAETGSSTATSRIFGVAAGADYWLSPATVAGFAVAGGGTHFGVAAGSGRSDLFQAGSFIQHMAGSAYLSAAAAYGWDDVTTDRTVTISGIDQLRGRFNASTFSARFEGGDRVVTPWFGGLGLTPYGAAQVTTTHLPGYGETVVSGANTFALSYLAKNVTAPRTELGWRSDKSFALDQTLLTLRGRAAWAHDFNTDNAASATFQALPGASFVVYGAAAAHDAALTTAAAEMKWPNGVSIAATFEGEFSAVTRSYAGKGVASYNW